MNEYVICPNCGYKNIGKNIFGKICINCANYIEPFEPASIIKEAEEKKIKNKEKIINYLREKYAN